jgi:DNA-binding response OmpR family regulator
MSRILIVDDEQHIADGLSYNLRAEGHDTVVAGNGERALHLLLEDRQPFDVVVLDVMLPGKDGFETAAELRAAGHYVPILMLTARGRADDVLRGFEAGADDYVPKPFELPILIARIEGLLRRHQWNERRAATDGAAPAGDDGGAPDSFAFAGRTIDFQAMEIRSGDRAFQLTQMECDLLRYLVRNAGKAVSRGAILEDVWDLHESTDTRAIDNFVVRLRRYIEDRPAAPKFLLTVRGVGYKFVPEGA